MKKVKKVTCREFIEEFQLDKTWRKEGSDQIKVTAQEIISSPLCDIEEGVILSGAESYIIIDEENLSQEYETITE